MALLDRCAGILIVVVAAGCAQDGKNGIAAVDIYEQPVLCDSTASVCAAPGAPAVPVDPEDRQRSGLSFVSRAASQYGEGGLYLYLELHRPGGLVATLELDLPVSGAAQGQAPHAVYQEHRDGRRVFASSLRAGRVELPAGEGCPCRDILLELVFTDLGPDGMEGTADDQTRRLSRGVIGEGQAFCLAPRLLPIASANAIEVGQTCHALPATGGPGGGSSGGSGGYYGGSAGESVEVGCAAEPAYTEDDSGCDGSGSDYDYGDESSGCDGDGLGDSSSGCDGGDWGDSSGSGCDGGGSAPSCEGDAFAAVRQPSGRRAPLRARILGTILPFALFGLFTAYLRRRSRR